MYTHRPALFGGIAKIISKAIKSQEIKPLGHTFVFRVKMENVYL